MKIVRSKEYYRQFWEILEVQERKMLYHVRQAERCKTIYTATKGKRGIFHLLNDWAYYMNQKHCDLGSKIGKELMADLLNEMIELNKISNKKEEP